MCEWGDIRHKTTLLTWRHETCLLTLRKLECAWSCSQGQLSEKLRMVKCSFAFATFAGQSWLGLLLQLVKMAITSWILLVNSLGILCWTRTTSKLLWLYRLSCMVWELQVLCLIGMNLFDFCSSTSLSDWSIEIFNFWPRHVLKWRAFLPRPAEICWKNYWLRLVEMSLQRKSWKHCPP